MSYIKLIKWQSALNFNIGLHFSFLAERTIAGGMKPFFSVAYLN